MAAVLIVRFLYYKFTATTFHDPFQVFIEFISDGPPSSLFRCTGLAEFINEQIILFFKVVCFSSRCKFGIG